MTECVTDPVLLGTKFCYDYFSLNAQGVAEGLAPDVKFTVNAAIYSPGEGPSKPFTVGFEGKDIVMEVLDARHFGIVEKLELSNLSFYRMNQHKMGTDFVSIETKREGETSVTYKYVGTIETSFNEDMKIDMVSLKNDRYCL